MHSSWHGFADKFFKRPFERKSGIRQLEKAMKLYGGMNTNFMEDVIDTSSDKDFVQDLCMELGSMVGGVEDEEDDWFELRTKASTEPPLFGRPLLFVVVL